MVDIETYKNNISYLVEVAKKYTINVVLLGLTPVDETKMPLGNHYFSNKIIKEYDAILREISENEETGYIDFYSSLIEKEKEEILSDGLHPNDKGYQIMYEILKKYLEENNLVEFSSMI